MKIPHILIASRLALDSILKKTINIIQFTFIVSIIFFSCISANAQRLKTETVLKTADSILLSNTNEKIIKYFNGYTGSYQKFKKGKYYSTRDFVSNKKLKNSVSEIWILYHFSYPNIDGLKYGTWVKLDKNLNLIEPIDLTFIPEFILQNEERNFITKEEALKIGLKNFQKDGIRINEPKLEFNKSYKTFLYKVENVFSITGKNVMGNDIGEMEVVFINPVSGKVVENTTSVFGIIVR